MPTLTRRTLLASAAATAAAFSVGAFGTPAHGADHIRPFRIAVPERDLDDLRARLAMTRWPDAELVDDASQGARSSKVRDLVEYWQSGYDWRRVEAVLNGYPQFMTEIDGVDIHFLHIRSPHADALPMIMTHGWPGSIVELLKVIGPLTDPTAHGGRAEDAFHLVLPSLPGYGFSGKPRETGWDRHRVARAWHALMVRLGYDRYVAQGGDWGAVISQAMAHQAPEGLIGIHVNMPAVVPKVMPAKLSADEQAAMDALQVFFTKGMGYGFIQATRPQTIGYALADSPVGQAAWIYEKLADWSDSGGDPETVFTKDEILDDVMFYWLTNSATSSARLYWENSDLAFYAVGIDIPVAVTVFPREIYRAPKSWAQQAYPRLAYWSEVGKGGHFAAFEQPELFSREVRAAFRAIRRVSGNG